MNTSHTVRGVILVWTEKGPASPQICLVKKWGGRSYEQKRGWRYREKSGFGLPGGKVEGNETFLEAVAREIRDETGIVLMPDFSEICSFHAPEEASQRVGSDSHQNHFYLAVLGDLPLYGEIEETVEIAEVRTFALDSLPQIPYRHISGLARVLRHSSAHISEAEEWAKMVEMQIPCPDRR